MKSKSNIRIEKYEILPGKFVRVVRCDEIKGGFKRLAVANVYTKVEAAKLVFASNSFGTGPIALTLSLENSSKTPIIFLSKFDSMSANLALCEKHGAVLDFTGNSLPNDSYGLREEAMQKYNSSEYEVLPLGLENEEVKQNIIKLARGIFASNPPKDLWVVAASGLTIRALREALPQTNFHAVLVKGNSPDVSGAKVYIAKEDFATDATVPPPYPSNKNYDAKVWALVQKEAQEGEISNDTVVFNIA